MIANARFTRNWPEAAEKRLEAERQVHMAMFRRALGEISGDERDGILAILRPCVPDFFETPASAEDKWASPLMGEPPAE